MQQSIFIIRHDFFDNPLAGKEFVKKLVVENCKTEKIALVFDPLAEDFFTHVAKSNRDKFETIVRDFYSGFENDNEVMPLKWYQLDEVATFHITFLAPLMYELPDHFGTYLIGCLPLLHYDPNLYVYFCMSNYDIEDVYMLMSGKHYMKTLEENITGFNDFVCAEKLKTGKKLTLLQKK